MWTLSVERCIKGWAQNSDNLEVPVCLDIYVDGRVVGQTLANRYRKDLERAGLGSGNHSFAFTPPTGLAFCPDTVKVRRSLDGAVLQFATASRQPQFPLHAIKEPSRPCAVTAKPSAKVRVHRRAASI